MKNFFSKSLLGLGVFIVMSVCAQAQTPIYAPNTLVANIALNGGSATNLGTPSTASYQYGVVAYVGKQSKVAVSIVATNSKADAVNGITLYYARSILGSSNTFESTLNPIGYTTTAADINPATPRVIVTNLDTLGCGYIIFPYLTNASGSTTNVGSFSLYYGTKISTSGGD